MKVLITFRHMNPTDTLKDYVNDKLNKLNKLVHKPIEANVVLTSEKHNRSADITLSAKNFSARGEVTTSDIMASVDGAVHKVEKSLRRHKEKKKNGKSRSYDENFAEITSAGESK